jgi:hypothetical protein
MLLFGEKRLGWLFASVQLLSIELRITLTCSTVCVEPDIIPLQVVKLITKHPEGSKRLRGNAALLPALLEIVECYREDPAAWKICKRSYRCMKLLKLPMPFTARWHAG